MNVLISIKPKYVKEILCGNKMYEYRKRIFSKDVEKIYIYSTSPEQKIVGYFEYKGYLKETPQILWDKTKKLSGIDEKSYYEYFCETSQAYALKIEKFCAFETPINPKEKFAEFVPPQSYKYLQGDIY